MLLFCMCNFKAKFVSLRIFVEHNFVAYPITVKILAKFNENNKIVLTYIQIETKNIMRIIKLID